MKLRYQLPPVYQALLPREILDFAPEETKATCDTCAMSKPRHRGKIHYREDLKCCTFHPFLPNYMVGALLKEDEGAGQKVLRSKIEKREYALPIGMTAPVNFQVPFNHRTEMEFGNREDWLCPYYDKEKQNCGVWRHRGVVCTTFFCKSSFGKVGLQFWEKLNSYLWYVELALLEEALVMLDFSPRQIIDLLDYHNRFEGTPEEMKSSFISEKKARDLWNGYYNDQEGFYKKAHDIVMKIDKKSFHEMIGEQGQSLEEDLFTHLPLLQKEE